ncbi:MAG: polysaccharide biosynthesis protein [Candidatus Limnocylindria bacterium]
MLDDKRVLVTGGTGSLGRALVRRLLSGELGKPAKVVVFSRDEAKQHEMRAEWHRPRVPTEDAEYRDYKRVLEFKIGDVRDYDSISAAVRDAHIVFHAAALKQVPSCEYEPIEAVKTNVLGASNVVRAILAPGADVEVALAVSTDKACKPVNVMGMTKALQERIFVNGNLGHRTKFLCVRYGNVISSRGSVIPLFLDQIRAGGPVTITMDRMTRFLLTLDKAVDTIFAAVTTGQPGDTYIPRVPSASVMDVAKALIGDRKIAIEIIGVRPGEKVHEILISEEEVFRTIERGEYYVIRPVLPELGGGGPPARSTEYSSSELTLDIAGVRRLLAEAGTAPAPSAVASR